MAKPNLSTTLVPVEPALDGLYVIEGESEEVNRAFLRYVREGKADESPEEFARREYTGDTRVREGARSLDWANRRSQIVGHSRDISTKQAQADMAESTRRFMPVINDVTDILRSRLNDLKAANTSVIDPTFDILFKDVERIARTLAALQTSLAKQNTINIVNANSNSNAPAGDGSPKFDGWGSANIIDHKR